MSCSPGWWQRCKNRPGHWGLREERGARGPASTGGREGPCVPTPLQRSSVLSGLHLHRVQGGKRWQWSGSWCRSADRKALLERKWLNEAAEHLWKHQAPSLLRMCAQTSFQLLLNYSIRRTWFHYIVQSRRVNYVTETCRGAINPLTLALMGKHAAAPPTRAAAARKQKPGGLFSRRSYDAYQQTCYRVIKRWGSSSVTVNFRKLSPAPPWPLSPAPERGKSPRPPLRAPFALRHFRSATTSASQPRRLSEACQSTAEPAPEVGQASLSISCSLRKYWKPAAGRKRTNVTIPEKYDF